ncbi:hypothetical protein EAE96_010933 [Botrytis aclada]|nr:hypothetical protein EAE96_010933 [Botrytis aclada]
MKIKHKNKYIDKNNFPQFLQNISSSEKSLSDRRSRLRGDDFLKNIPLIIRHLVVDFSPLKSSSNLQDSFTQKSQSKQIVIGLLRGIISRILPFDLVAFLSFSYLYPECPTQIIQSLICPALLKLIEIRRGCILEVISRTRTHSHHKALRLRINKRCKSLKVWAVTSAEFGRSLHHRPPKLVQHAGQVFV